MQEIIQSHHWFIGPWLNENLPDIWMRVVAGLFILALAYGVLHWISTVLVRGFLQRVMKRMGFGHWLIAIQRRHVFDYLSISVPLFITATGLGLVPVEQVTLAVVERFIIVVALFYLFRSLNAGLLVIQDIYERKQHMQHHSLKGYLQLMRIVLGCIAFVILVSVLINKSPLLMISGFGALSAVLLLVFKDTLLSLVASAQISTNDMLRVGDWIEMPQAGADGFVIDIALHTVKVQNWDKTVTTIPTYKLFSESYKNWRQMFESGGRRIKRSLRIDASTVRFLTNQEIEGLKRFKLIKSYLSDKYQQVIQSYDEAKQMNVDPVNSRRLTNIGTFRAYANAYLKQKEGVHEDMIMMVRMMEPTAEGIPIEIYCFSSDTAWVNFEALQGDIFDHLIAILPEMGLRLYQSPAGADLSGAFSPHPPFKHDLEQNDGDA